MVNEGREYLEMRLQRRAEARWDTGALPILLGISVYSGATGSPGSLINRNMVIQFVFEEDCFVVVCVQMRQN